MELQPPEEPGSASARCLGEGTKKEGAVGDAPNGLREI